MRPTILLPFALAACTATVTEPADVGGTTGAGGSTSSSSSTSPSASSAGGAAPSPFPAVCVSALCDPACDVSPSGACACDWLHAPSCPEGMYKSCCADGWPCDAPAPDAVPSLPPSLCGWCVVEPPPCTL